MTEAALALSEQKAQDLGELLTAAEQERQSLLQRQEKERKLEQQVGAGLCGPAGRRKYLATAQLEASVAFALLTQEAADRESKLLRDLSAANEKNLLLRSQVSGGCGFERVMAKGG